MEECRECEELFEFDALNCDEIDGCYYCDSCHNLIIERRKDDMIPDYEFNGNSDWWRDE